MKIPDYIVIQTFKDCVKNAKRVGRQKNNADVVAGTCPFCGDPEKRSDIKFYLYKGAVGGDFNVHCKVCNYSKKFTTFLKDNFPEKWEYIKSDGYDALKQKTYYTRKNILVVAEEEKKKTPSEEIHDYLSRFFKVNCIKLDEEQEHPENEKIRLHARNKMAKRGLSEEVFNNYLICYNGPYYDRVLIPFFNKEGLVYNFQGRDIQDHPDEIRKNKKYIFAQFDAMELPDDKIYKMYLADPEKTVYICEGIIDSEFVDNGVALCGVSTSQEKLDYIKAMWPKRTYCIDSPWSDAAGYNKIFDLLSLGERCFIIPKEYKHCKDMNDLAVALKVFKIPEEFIEKNTYEGQGGWIRLKAMLAVHEIKAMTPEEKIQSIQQKHQKENRKQKWDSLILRTKKR